MIHYLKIYHCKKNSKDGHELRPIILFQFDKFQITCSQIRHFFLDAEIDLSQFLFFNKRSRDFYRVITWIVQVTAVVRFESDRFHNQLVFIIILPFPFHPRICSS